MDERRPTEEQVEAESSSRSWSGATVHSKDMSVPFDMTSTTFLSSSESLTWSRPTRLRAMEPAVELWNSEWSTDTKGTLKTSIVFGSMKLKGVTGVNKELHRRIFLIDKSCSPEVRVRNRHGICIPNLDPDLHL